MEKESGKGKQIMPKGGVLIASRLSLSKKSPNGDFFDILPPRGELHVNYRTRPTSNNRDVVH